MKETLVDLLQQRMDKCTNEQFWAVASLTTADGFLISEHGEITKSLSPFWLIVLMITLSSYGIFIVWSRHAAYYRNRKTQAKLLEDEPDAPDFLKVTPKKSTGNTLSGLGFYCIWILASGVVTGLVVISDGPSHAASAITSTVSSPMTASTAVEFLEHFGLNVASALAIAAVGVVFYLWQRIMRFKNAVRQISRRIEKIGDLKQQQGVGHFEVEIERLVHFLDNELARLDHTVLRLNIERHLAFAEIKSELEEWIKKFREQSPAALEVLGRISGLAGANDPEFVQFQQFIRRMDRFADDISLSSFLELDSDSRSHSTVV